MYVELEHQYNNHGLIELENQLDQDRRELQSRFDESKAMYQLRKGQAKILMKEEKRSN